MRDLIKELDELLEETKVYGKIGKIFSDDEPTQTIVKLRKLIAGARFRVKISELKEFSFPKGKPINETRDTGKFVKVRPCGEKYGNKTFLGIMIGDGALSSSISIDEDSILCSWSFYNPAILVPELGEVIYGCGSWWGAIKSEEDLKSITDLDIENIWYVKALKQLNTASEATP